MLHPWVNEDAQEGESRQFTRMHRKGNQDSSPTRQFTDTVFEDSSLTDLKTVHRHF